MELKKILLIVDGPTEQGALKAKFNKDFHSCPEIRIGPGNGVTYTTEGYAKGVLPTILLALSSKVYAIILIPDHEKRKGPCVKFASELKTKIKEELSKCSKYKSDYIDKTIHVCPPNIMFENWIISDVEGIKNGGNLIRSNSIQKSFEGKNGATELSKLMNTKYKKTVHAQSLFKKVRDDIGKSNSESYKKFIECCQSMITTHC